jgi:hypothetical protein
VAVSCDWEHYHVTNSIPVRGKKNLPPMHVFIGLDGLAAEAIEAVREEGAFTDERWRTSVLIPMFPATSDSSWTRMLRTERFGGYEYEHYDPTADVLRNGGYTGVLVHGIPPFDGSPLSPPSYASPPVYYGVFDHHADAYLDAFWAYEQPTRSLNRSLDGLFVALAGRAKTEESFAAYVLETDVLGHMTTRRETLNAIIGIAERIESFRKAHTHREFFFTLFTDHGLDFEHKPEDKVIHFGRELAAVGVRSVKSFAEGRSAGGPWAVPVIHTRVTYVALHTAPEHREEVALRASSRASVELVVAALDHVPEGAPMADLWVGLWRKGELLVRFGHRLADDTYILPTHVDWAALDIPLSVDPSEPWAEVDDETLFALSCDRTYPDLFFRARTALAPISVRFPADVIVSLAPRYLSVGFELPGTSNDLATSGSHGAMHRAGSRGALLTDARELPPFVRSDSLLELFPELRRHIERRGLKVNGEPAGAGLDYARIFP